MASKCKTAAIGQGVAGSNPVSPTDQTAPDLRKRGVRGGFYLELFGGAVWSSRGWRKWSLTCANAGRRRRVRGGCCWTFTGRKRLRDRHAACPGRSVRFVDCGGRPVRQQLGLATVPHTVKRASDCVAVATKRPVPWGAERGYSGRSVKYLVGHHAPEGRPAVRQPVRPLVPMRRSPRRVRRLPTGEDHRPAVCLPARCRSRRPPQ